MSEFILLVAFLCNSEGCSHKMVDGVSYLHLCNPAINPRTIADFTDPQGKRMVVSVGPCQET